MAGVGEVAEEAGRALATEAEVVRVASIVHFAEVSRAIQAATLTAAIP